MSGTAPKDDRSIKLVSKGSELTHLLAILRPKQEIVGLSIRQLGILSAYTVSPHHIQHKVRGRVVRTWLVHPLNYSLETIRLKIKSEE